MLEIFILIWIGKVGREVLDEKRKREIHKYMNLLRLEEEVVQKEQRQVERFVQFIMAWGWKISVCALQRLQTDLLLVGMSLPTKATRYYVRLFPHVTQSLHQLGRKSSWVHAKLSSGVKKKIYIFIFWLIQWNFSLWQPFHNDCFLLRD